MRGQKGWGVVVLWVFMAQRAFSSEGFSTDLLPAQLEQAWGATVQIETTVTALKNIGKVMQHRGSGVVVGYDPQTKRGVIATNHHLAGCGSKQFCNYTIRVHTDREDEVFLSHSRVKNIGNFPRVDLAFLEVEFGNDVVPDVAKLSESMVDEKVYSVGYPVLTKRRKGLWTTPYPSDAGEVLKRWSSGSFSGFQQNLQFKDYPSTGGEKVTFLAPSAAVHDADTLVGNSGGPLVNSGGEVIGINTGIANAPKNMEHCGPENGHVCFYFAIPSSIITEKLKILGKAM